MVHRSGDDGLQSPMMGTQGAEKGQYKFHFNIGSIDSFERKMEEAQEDLGWGTDSFVPITYTNELSWQQVCCCSYLKPSFGLICLHHCKPVQQVLHTDCWEGPQVVTF